MASPYKSKGLVLYGRFDGVNYVAVGEITSLKPPAAEQQFEDTTVLESDHVEDGEPVGLATPGECSGEILYDPTDSVHVDFAEQCGEEDVEPILWEIRKAATVRWRFEGTARKLEPTAAVKQFVKASFNIKCRDIPDINPA